MLQGLCANLSRLAGYAQIRSSVARSEPGRAGHHGWVRLA